MTYVTNKVLFDCMTVCLYVTDKAKSMMINTEGRQVDEQ